MESIIDYERDESRTVRNTVPPWGDLKAPDHERDIRPEPGDA